MEKANNVGLYSLFLYVKLAKALFPVSTQKSVLGEDTG
jgi:hypothetical protein